MDSPDLSVSSESLLEHATWVRKLALELVRDPGLADDLAQETWLAFLRARPDTERPLRPWLARVLRNAAALRARRGAGRGAREQEVARPERVPSAHELVERAEEQRKLAGAVLDLDDPYRTTLLLRYYEDLSPAEIARSRGLPPATVRTHLHRGLAELRRRLDEEHGGDRRAWILMLQPLLPRPEPALGVATLAVAAVLVVVATIGGLRWAGRGDTPAPLERTGQAEPRSEVDGLGAAPTGAGRRSSAPGAVAPPALTVRSLRIRDAAGRALEAYAVRVDGSVLTTDARGELRVPPEVSSLLPVDDERLAVEAPSSHGRRRRRALEQKPVELPELGVGDELELPTGPTYRLLLESSEVIAPERLEARLVNQAASEEVQRIQLAPVRPAQGGFDVPWVRFGEAPSNSAAAPADWRLELRDALGWWRGGTGVERVESASRSEVSLALVHTAAVEGHVDGVLPELLGELTVVLLHQADPSRPEAWAVPTEGGDFALRWVPAGEYVLRIISPVHQEWASEFVLQPGDRVIRNATLEAASTAGPVRGVLSSESGSYRGQVLVFLLDSNDLTIDVFPTTWRADDDGRLTAPFLFENTPEGELHLDVVSLADAVRFHASPVGFAAPLEDLRVELLDEEPAADWSFEVLSHATGELLEDFEVEVRVDGGAPRSFTSALRENEAGEPTRAWTLVAGNLRWNQFEGPAPLRNLAKDAQLSWTVRAKGYQEQGGSGVDFNTQSSGDRCATVYLHPE